MTIRKPPRFPYRPGFCQWCDEAIRPRLKKDGQPCKIQAAMHRDCSDDYWRAMNPSRHFDTLVERDGRHCGDCGERDGDEVDHKIPLWKVAHLPPKERREYFLIGNLWLLCSDCHKRKSAKEAAERAHLKRLAKGPKQRKGRPIQSRPFDKGKRKLQSRNTFERRA